MATDIHKLLATNRAEEFGADVWEDFVLPPFFGNLSVGQTRKPKVIIGGRGCGKTMLLRYLSHESAFSPNRQHIPSDALSHIGLYWRADTQFASLLQHRGIPVDTWESAFRHLAAVVLGIEVLRSLESIARSSFSALGENAIASIDLSRLQAFSADLPSATNLLRDYLEDRLAEFENWANNVRTAPEPLFLPGHQFIQRMIELIRSTLPEFHGAVFFVYIDEYENLATYQQRIINTWLKHSEPPLVFNLAMKRNGFKTSFTEGQESLSKIHDYRDIDLEDFDLDNEFPVFAAEILLLRLKLGGMEVAEIEPDYLRESSQLRMRRTPEYISRVLTAVKNVFPSLSRRELAAGVFADSSLNRRLKERINRSLEDRGISEDERGNLASPRYPEASIILPALLRRKALSVTEVKDELEKLQANEANRFTGPTNWIHNNFVGCLLQLYDGLGRPCPFYGGFSSYCLMSHGNLRHYLELCRQALARLERSHGNHGVGEVSVNLQAEAARQVSADLLPEVRSFGPQGNNLHTFVLRLGSLFSLSQQSPTQSEPERTHFSIQGDDAGIGKKEVEFLKEAVKWSVLFEEKGTKKKNEHDPEGVEYVLNPIYAPYFHISFRKRRKLDLPSGDVTTLICGSYENVRQLLREYQRRWAVDLAQAPLPLFAHLDEENQE